jgi:hypothetical protein
VALLKDESLFYHLIHLSPRCTVRINDPMHVRFLLFCVCWVWYYTYFVEYYLDTYAMLLVCSIVPCPAVSRVFYGIWMFHPSILRSLSCWISLSSVIFGGTYIHLCIDKKEFMHMFLCVLDYIRWACVLRCQCYAFRLQDCLLFAWVLTGMYLSSIATMQIHNIGVYSLLRLSMVLLMPSSLCGCCPFHRPSGLSIAL